MSYTSIFGGATINPTLLSYASYTITSSRVLVWPFEALDDSSVAADKLDISAGAGLTVTMPNATLVSVGQDILFNNVGANTFTVLDSAGNTLASVASGAAWYLYLTVNSTAAGTWKVFQFGAGTSSANASTLAGAGLNAVTTLLNQNLPSTSLNGNYSVGIGDRATVLVNSGGAVAWTFASAVTLLNGWFVYAINAGTGNVTLTAAGGQTIDGSATKVLGPNESCIVFGDGALLHSLGYGRQVTSTVTAAAINAAGTGTLTLTANQIAAQVQDFSGALTGNRFAEYGTGVGFYFVSNTTTGAFTLTCRVNGIDPGAVIAQSTFSILRSNGTSVVVAFTATTGTVTNIATTATDLTGGPITTTGTLGLANTAVTAGSYGAASSTLTASVDSKGRLTALAASAIQIAISQITAFTSAAFAGQLTNPTGTGLVVLNTSPTITTPTITNGIVGTQVPANNTTLAASTAFVAAAVTAGVVPAGSNTQVQYNNSGAFAGSSSLTFNSSTSILTAALGSSTATTQSATDNSTKLATTAFVQSNFVQSLGSNGYTFLPGGLLVQWGNIPAFYPTSAVTYPIPFPTSVYGISLTANSGTSGQSASDFVDAITTSGFVAHNMSGTFYATAFYYIALGK